MQGSRLSTSVFEGRLIFTLYTYLPSHILFALINKYVFKAYLLHFLVCRQQCRLQNLQSQMGNQAPAQYTRMVAFVSDAQRSEQSEKWKSSKTISNLCLENLYTVYCIHSTSKFLKTWHASASISVHSTIKWNRYSPLSSISHGFQLPNMMHLTIYSFRQVMVIVAFVCAIPSVSLMCGLIWVSFIAAFFIHYTHSLIKENHSDSKPLAHQYIIFARLLQGLAK